MFPSIFFGLNSPFQRHIVACVHLKFNNLKSIAAGMRFIWRYPTTSGITCRVRGIYKLSYLTWNIPALWYSAAVAPIFLIPSPIQIILQTSISPDNHDFVVLKLLFLHNLSQKQHSSHFRNHIQSSKCPSFSLSCFINRLKEISKILLM